MNDKKRFKRYIVFAYEDCYPSGGLGDIDYSYDTLKEAKHRAKTSKNDNAYVVDRDTWEEVYER